jgi:hypothetical protein
MKEHTTPIVRVVNDLTDNILLLHFDLGPELVGDGIHPLRDQTMSSANATKENIKNDMELKLMLFSQQVPMTFIKKKSLIQEH